MGFIKDIKSIKKDVEEINSKLTKETLEKAQKYDELKELLQNICFDVEIVEGLDDKGENQYTLLYKNPEVILNFDEYGDPIKNNFFYSMNMLDLLSYESTQKLYNIIIKEKNKKMLR